MDKAIEYIQNSQLVVSHAGIGTIFLCKEYGIPIIIIPKRKKYGEHMNDHQLEIAKTLEKREDENIFVIYEEDQLLEKILEFLKGKKTHIPAGNVGRVNLVRTIKEFLQTV
jgi:UDP-N-acetylglucosamine transferase subunit ALG13